MNGRFFEDLLESSVRPTREGKRALRLPVSNAIHAVIILAVLVVPYLRYKELPEPALGTVRAFLVESNAAPPPPPPPPAAPKAAVSAPTIRRPRPVVEKPQFTAPVAVHKEVPREEGVVDPHSVADVASPTGGRVSPAASRAEWPAVSPAAGRPVSWRDRGRRDEGGASPARQTDPCGRTDQGAPQVV